MYKIVAQENSKFTIELDINSQIFAGHFPNNPIMPGVFTLKILQELIERFLNKKIQLRKLKNIKFIKLISPSVNKTLVYDFRLDLSNPEYFSSITSVYYDEIVFAKISSTYTIIES